MPLIDEIDRADDEFEAFLFEVLAESAVTIPEVGTVRAAVPPVAVLTSDRTRDQHDALKRRCLYHWIGYPDAGRVEEIIRRRVPGAAGWLASQVAGPVHRLRGLELYKPPGVAEAISWINALHVLGATTLDAAAADRTLGAVLKYDEDTQSAKAAGLATLIPVHDPACLPIGCGVFADRARRVCRSGTVSPQPNRPAGDLPALVARVHRRMP